MPATSAINSEARGIWTLRDAERFKRAGTWPVSPTDDPYFFSISLLLRMEGTAGSTQFTDSSLNALAATSSGPTLSTAQVKSGATSAAFAGGNISFGSNAAFGWGTGDMTVEFWLYYTGGNGYVFFWINNPGSGNYLGYGLNAGSRNPWLWNNGDVLTTSTAVQTNVWQHHAVVRSAGQISIFLNGVLLNSASFSADLGSSRPFFIGDNSFGSQTTAGFMDDFRVTKAARYLSSFTPPGPI